MPLEINDCRNSPMMFSKSPLTPRTGIDLERNSPHGRNLRIKINENKEQFKDVSNLKVNSHRRRSFTPVKNSLFLRSPDLSPIVTANSGQNTPINSQVEASCSLVFQQLLTPVYYKGFDQSPSPAFQQSPVNYKELDQSLTPVHCKDFDQSLNPVNNKESDPYLTPVEFKVPQPLNNISCEGTTPTTSFNHHPHGKETQSDDLDQTSILDKSASHGYLNHKLDVRLILKNANMQQYIEAFDKEKMDFGKFLSLCEEDLLRLGVNRKVDRKVLFSIISDLNAN